MAGSLHTTFWNLKDIVLKENCYIFFSKCAEYFLPRGPIKNKPSLGQMMAWNETTDNVLYEPMVTQFIYVYMRHSASMS